MALPSIRAQSPQALAEFFQSRALPKWRLEQLLDWLYAKRARSWSELSNLPKSLRAELAQAFDLSLPQLIAVQGPDDPLATRKFLWQFTDGALVESVLIPANPALYGESSDRRTLCISTQVGCAYGCRFCASGLDGWKRNLHPDEILGQLLAVERWHAELHLSPSPNPAHPQPPPSPPAARPISPHRLIDNIVVMGMGEPLANYDALLQALRTLNAPWGAGIGARKITVSTSGLVPQIRQLAREPEQFRLAISLHGATDDVRSRIMPVNRKYPLRELADACADYLQSKGRMITFEYILLAGVNDSLDQVPPLAALARRLHAKVNLIPYNHVDGLPWERPPEDRCEAFSNALSRAGVTATLRREKGHDIDAACGQLRLRTERQLPTPLHSSPAPTSLP